MAIGKNPLKSLLGESLHMPDRAWRILAVRFGVYYLFCAVLNEVMWRTQPEQVWFYFRFPGLQIMAVLFTFTQVPFMMKHMKDSQRVYYPTKNGPNMNWRKQAKRTRKKSRTKSPM